MQTILTSAAQLTVDTLQNQINRKANLPYKNGSPSPLYENLSATIDLKRGVIIVSFEFYMPFLDAGRAAGKKPVPIKALLRFIDKRGIVPKVGAKQKDAQRRNAIAQKRTATRIKALTDSLKKAAALAHPTAKIATEIIAAKKHLVSLQGRSFVPTKTQLAFMIQKSIVKKGIRGRKFIEPAVHEIESVLLRNLGNSLNDLVTKEVGRVFGVRA